MIRLSEIITRDNWIKDGLISQDSRHACVEGHAYLEYCTGVPMNAIDFMMHVSALRKAARQLFPERLPSRSYLKNPNALTIINDHRDTVFEDIEKILKRAEEILEEEGHL